jgi:alpha-galactosidase
MLSSLRRIVPLGVILAVGCASPQLMVATFVPSRPGVVTATHVNVTGNWLAAVSMNDGTFRRSYFDLLQRGDTITGTVRTTQFYFDIVESAWDSTGFTITGAMKDGGSVRRQEWHGRLVGDSLHLVAIRRPAPGAPATPRAAVTNASTTSAPAAPPRPQPELVAYRVPPGEGAMPAKIPPPARHVVRDNGIARTPAMGWNSWNKFAGRVTDADVRAMADAMVSNGMRDAGYVYVNIDDTWEGDKRDSLGNITTNSKFPDMKALADYVHSKGLKLGIYSSPGPTTCAGYIGSYGHEAQDAKTFADWGIDYLKYDWCGARMLYRDDEMPAVYQVMGDALIATGRPIVYSLCQYGRQDVWKWGADVGGNSWRTTGDIRDTWESMANIGFRQDVLAPYAKPGHFNDPDMLEIGNGGMTNEEYRTHMSLWAMLAAPLLAGNDLRTMSLEVLGILTNKEVIRLDQDPLGKQGTRVLASPDSASVRQEIWTRPLANGAYAVAAFNRGPDSARVMIDFAALNIDTQGATVRDLWAHRKVRVRDNRYTATIPSHGVVMLRVGR